MKNALNSKILIPIIMVILILLTVFAVWKTNPIDYNMYKNDTITYVKAKVVSVNSENIEESSDVPGRHVGVQNITVRFTQGDQKGESVTLDNHLSTTHSIEVTAGTRVIVKCDRPEGVTPYYSIYQYDRSAGIIVGLMIFLFLLVLVGKTKGLRAALALLISVLVIAGGLIPSVYNGHSPIIATLIACLIITAATLVLLNGFSKKTAVAVLATIIGLVSSALFYFLAAKLLSVTGYTLDETEELIIISRHTGLTISQILFSGILISSLGAVMDTAMSIASSLFEMVAANNKMKSSEIFRSGMNIGGDMIGTMCQTLILAFTGSSIAALLVIVSYGTKLNQFLYSDFLALEILQALTGSFAVVLAVPITSFICSVIHKKGTSCPAHKRPFLR